MARFAVADGIQKCVATPHWHAGRYDNTATTIQDALDQARQLLQEHEIPLQLSAAAEVRIDAQLMEWIEQEDFPWLGLWENRKVVLLELPHQQIPVGADKLIRWLNHQSVWPIIAHPERNKTILRDYQAVYSLLDAGCGLQITADAIAGGFGPLAQERAVALMEDNAVTLAASDGHNMHARPPRLSAGYAATEKMFGAAYAQMLFQENPATIATAHFA